MRRWYPRAPELGFLFWPCAIALLGISQLHLARAAPWTVQDSLLLATIPGVALAAHLWLVVRHSQADHVLLAITLALGAIGLVTVERLREDLGLRQALWLCLGLLGIISGTGLATHREILLRYRYSIGALGLVLTAATLVFGVDPNGSGARLWFSFGGISLQPVELLKVLLVIWLAGYLHEHGEVLRHASSRLGPLRAPPLAYLIPLGIVFGLTELLLVIQRDLGAGLLISVVFVLMIYMATGRLSLLLVGLTLLIGAGWLAASLFSPVALRVDIWLDPWRQSDAGGYQIVQGLIALAHGGILGTGLSLGFPSFVPAVHTDFSIVAIGEELGLAGGLAVIGLYALLLHRGIHIALSLDDDYDQLLAAGLTCTIAVQTILILAGVLKLLPLTGITLPWVSYGGSSILANSLIVGILLGLARQGEVHRAQ